MSTKETSQPLIDSLRAALTTAAQYHPRRKKPQTTNVSTRVPVEVHQALAKIAETEDTTLGEIARLALYQYLRDFYTDQEQKSKDTAR